MTDGTLNQDAGSEIAPLQTPDAMSAVRSQDASDSKWQLRLLPFLVGTLIALTIFFCAAIAWETRTIQNRMDRAADIDLRPLANAEFRTNGPFLLEADLIERRYRAASVAALSRIYLVFLGFGTGMVMALVGAAFILGKLSEPETSIDGGGSSFKASLRSGSPGVILAFFGTVLMLSTIFSKTDISVSDRAVYVGGGSGAAATQEPGVAESAKPETNSSGKGPLAAAQTASPAAPVAAVAKNDVAAAGVHLVMAGPPSLDGNYALEAHSGSGTLAIHAHQIQFTGSDGKKRQVDLKKIDDSHVIFSVDEPDGGHQDFDGFLTPPNNDIVGQTSYHGSYWTRAYGFVATRVKAK